MKPNDTIGVLLFVVVAFCVIYGWWLHRSCVHAVTVQAEYHLKSQEDPEAGRQGAQPPEALPAAGGLFT
jgi:hypothetical protein